MSGTSVATTNEATTSPDLTVYTITNAAHRVIDNTATTTVQTSPDGTTWTPVTTGFTIQYPIGKVVFTVANSAGTQVRLSVMSYLPTAIVADATDWSLDVQVDLKDTTVLNSSWKIQQPVIRSASAKFTRFYQIELSTTNMLSKINAGTPLGVIMYTDTVNNHGYAMYALMSQDSIKAAAQDLVMEDVTFVSVGQIYYF